MIVPDVFAIFAVDPGGTSGYASAILRNRKTVKQTLRRASRKGAFSYGQTRGSYDEQAWDLFDLYLSFHFRARIELGIPADAVYLVIEQFELRQRNVELSPVEIRSALVVQTRALTGRIEEQSASQAMTFATSDRLRNWGLWRRGFGGSMEHAADATRHLALRTSVVLRGMVE